MPGRSQKQTSSKKADCYNSVGVEIPIKNRCRGAGVIAEYCGIQRQARKRDNKQSDASEAQTGMRHTMKKPAKGCAFERPRNRNPLPLELDRENERNEKQGRAPEQPKMSFSRQTWHRLAAYYAARHPLSTRRIAVTSNCYVASDSLVDYRGCLTHRPERETFPCNINLQCCRSLDSPLDQSLGERVFHILL